MRLVNDPARKNDLVTDLHTDRHGRTAARETRQRKSPRTRTPQEIALSGHQSGNADSAEDGTCRQILPKRNQVLLVVAPPKSPGMIQGENAVVIHVITRLRTLSNGL